MTVLDRLASTLNRRDQVPNQELAREISRASDKKAIKELVDNLANESKHIQNDCIKVLYEIGELKPALIADYADNFLALLEHKNNQLQWGGMVALNTITPEKPEVISSYLPEVIAAAERGSVITRDNAVKVLISLCSIKKYADDAFSLLIAQLLKSPTNQLPMYAERILPIVNDDNRSHFINTLTSRLPDLEKESKRRRVEEVIKKRSCKRQSYHLREVVYAAEENASYQDV